MLEMMDIGINGVVAYRFGGKITEGEMKLALSAIEEKIRENQEVSIYQEIESIGGVTLDALMEKLKFFSKFGLSNIKKIVVVAHKDWIWKIIDLEGKFLKKIPMKGFSMDEKEAAIDFLRSG